MLYDNTEDPYQLENLVDHPGSLPVRQKLDALLDRKLEASGDAFLPGMDYIEQWGYTVDENGTVPYTN